MITTHSPCYLLLLRLSPPDERLARWLCNPLDDWMSQRGFKDFISRCVGRCKGTAGHKCWPSSGSHAKQPSTNRDEPELKSSTTAADGLFFKRILRADMRWSSLGGKEKKQLFTSADGNERPHKILKKHLAFLASSSRRKKAASQLTWRCFFEAKVKGNW